MNKKEKLWAWINSEYAKWNKSYPEVEIPKELSKKKQNQWLDEVYLAKEGKEIVISGGGRVLLWMVMRMHYPLPRVNTSWIKFIERQEKLGRKEYILEVEKFRRREKLLHLNLIQDKRLIEYPDAIIEDDKRGDNGKSV